MHNNTRRTRAFARGLLAGAALFTGFAGVALAQDSTDEEEIVVTGSRLPTPNVESISPVQAVTAEEFTYQGTFETSNVLNTLPQSFVNSATDFSNTPNPLSGPGGITTANLRGLGPQRTLVLIDGVRLGVGDSNAGNPNPGPNLDFIPGQLVERIEVSTGGASAVYGSDAVAGVVNFIMKDDFEGLQLDARYGFYQHDNDNSHVRSVVADAGLPLPDEEVTDGYNRDFSITLGMNSPDDRGNITVYLTYHNQEPVSQANRDFSGCLLFSIGTDWVCANSSNSNRFISLDEGAEFAVLGNQFVPWGTPGTNPPQTFNSSPYQFLSRDDTRYNAGFFSHYDINEHVEAYAQFNFMDDRTETEVGPTALFQQNGVVQINCDNPLMSAQQIGAICASVVDTDGVTPGNQGLAQLVIGRRNVEGGARLSTYEHETYRMRAGIRGDINETWSYDVYGQYYYSTLAQTLEQDFIKDRVQRALLVVDTPDGPACQSVVDGSDPLCVPWNIFTDGAVTQGALNYITGFGSANGSSEQQIVSAVLTADLGNEGVRLPGAQDGLALALGAEYRREEASYVPDSLWQSGQLTGAGGATPATQGAYDVQEFFGELRIPILQEAALAYDLSVDLGYRYSDYSNAGTTDTYKYGVQWAPTEDIRFRASFQRAVRAPNLTELFVPNYVTNSAILDTDPCAGTTPTATLAQCINTGINPADYGTGAILECPAGQCSVRQGGNPDVLPESSDTISYGFVLQPRFIPGLLASIDYYQIEQEDGIGSIPATTTFNNCLTTGDPVYCARVVRTPQGFLFGDTIEGGGWVFTPLENLASGTTSGVDVQALYRVPGLDAYGGVTIQFTGAYLIEATTKTDAASPEYDCASLFGPTCGIIAPEWRHTLRVTWDTPWDLSISAAWRHIGESTNEVNTNEPVIGFGPGTDDIDGTLEAIDYIDLSAVWNITPTIAIRGGVTNLFDEGPQVIAGFTSSGIGGPNAYPTYDLLGRGVFVGVTADF